MLLCRAVAMLCVLRGSPDFVGRAPQDDESNVFEPHAASGAQAVACLFDTTEKSRVVLETVVEPILFGCEADQHAAGLPWRVMTISRAAASRRKRERSSLTSDSGTSLIPDLRAVRAMPPPPI